MSISTIYRKINRDFYLRYFLKHPSLYPCLAQIALRKAGNMTGLKGKEVAHRRDLAWRFNTPERRRILERVKTISDFHVSPEILLQLPRLEFEMVETVQPAVLRIPLATCEVALDARIFEQSYPDPEDSFAANRFIWLFDVLHDHGHCDAIQACRNLMQHWAAAYPRPCNHSRFESYSISERLISWLFFLMFTRHHIPLREDEAALLASAMRYQLSWLTNHLEYHGNGTNNHILNNARALYISGRLLQLKQAEVLGRHIFLAEVDEIVRDGVYQEGSSHYQFLLTRNVLEMLLVAEMSDDSEFGRSLHPIVVAMLRTCYTLQPDGLAAIPLFGDISPDLKPAWFVGHPFQTSPKRASKWRQLFRFSPRVPVAEKKIGAKSSVSGPFTEWRHLGAGEFDVWVNLRNGGIPGHGHNDNGSICVFKGGQPVVVDLGLASYQCSPFDVVQVSAEGHNCPIVDGYGPDISKHSALSGSAVVSRYELISASATGIAFLIAFANDRVKIRRQLEVTPDGCKVVDCVLEAESFPCTVAVHWHLALDVMSASGGRFITSDLEMAILVRSPYRAVVARNFVRSESYGTKTLVCSLNFKAEVGAGAPFVFNVTRKYHEMAQ